MATDTWQEKMEATAAKNKAAGIDFTQGVTEDQLKPVGVVRQSGWVVKIHELVEGVRGGAGQMGVFYKLGTFGSKGGARTTISNLAKRVHELPVGAIVDLQSRAVPGGGSELWGAVVNDVTPPE